MHVTHLLRKGTYSQVSGTELSLLCPRYPPPWLTLLHLYEWGKVGGGAQTLLVECPSPTPILLRSKLKGEKKGRGVLESRKLTGGL